MKRTEPALAAAGVARPKSRLNKSSLTLILMALPGLCYLLINNILPMFGIIIAFKSLNYKKGIFGSDWVGFQNFKYLFVTSDAWIITRNTILYNLVFIALGTVLAIVFAILLNEIRSKLFMRLYQSVIILPNLISMVIVAYLVYALLSDSSGLMNFTVLPALGIEPFSWYAEPKVWPFILTAVNLWKSIGFSCIIYLATIVGINTEYYEAASLDGASRWQQIKNITLPLLKPTFVLLTILSVGRIFYSDFGLFYQVPRNSGALYDTTNTIDTYVFRGLMQLGDISMSSAAGVYQSIVGFILVMTANAVVRKLSREHALF